MPAMIFVCETEVFFRCDRFLSGKHSNKMLVRPSNFSLIFAGENYGILIDVNNINE